MTTDELLNILKDRGLQVYVADDGTPKLKGKREELSPRLLRVLKFHREEIVRRLKPRPPRRVVLLSNDDRDSQVEKVLQECDGEGHHDRVRFWSAQHPGRTVSAEWLQKDHSGERWTRFMWLRWPTAQEMEERHREEATATANEP
jgi:hypothetical protein